MNYMRKEIITENFSQTKKLGEILASELRGGKIICLSGDLGAGKTTFTQGLLKGLKIKGPYTSPTFMIIKHYHKKITKHKKQITNKIQNSSATADKIQNIYHIDAYRIKAKDILNLGWEEIIADPKNVVIIEWAERIKKIIPVGALWIKMEWVDQNKRKVTFK